MQFEPKTISIDTIDIENTLFQISTPKSIDDLVLSIKQVGLLSPPIVKAFHDRFWIVCGFHRIQACKTIGWSDIEARIMEPDASVIEGLMVAIADNAYHRKLNLIEQSVALSKLSKYCTHPNELMARATALGFGNNRAYIQKLMKLSTLSEELQRAIINSTISMTIALELDQLDQPSMRIVMDLFERLKLTFNEQKEIITLLKDISKIYGQTISDIFHQMHLNQQILDLDIDRPRKIQELRKYLHKLRFPVITRHYEKFQALIQNLKLPSHMKLIPPEKFEDVSYSMTFHFQSMDAFRSCLAILKNLSASSEFNALFNNCSENPTTLY